MDSKFNWKAYEYRHTDKSADWYWALWIIAIAVAATAILFKSILLAILVVVAAFAVSLFAARKPRLVEYEINEKGIVLGKSIMYPHRELDSFNIEHGQIILKSQKVMQPLIIIPLAEEAPENEIRAFLKQHLVEEDLHEPLSHLLMHYLGF